MDKKLLEELKVALKKARIDELLIDRFIDGALMSCSEACYAQCASCCSSGSGNRAVQ